MRMRFRPMPARQRRSSTSRISSRDEKVSATFRTRKIAQTACDTSNAPAAFWRPSRVGLHVQRGDDAEDHGENAADEDGEEIVDARTPAAQTIEALQMKPERHETGDERQDVDVLPERRQPARDRNEAGVKPERVRDDERRHAEQGVGDDVKGDEQPIVSNHAWRASTSASISSPNRSRPNRSAWRRMDGGIELRVIALAIASANASADRIVDQHAGHAGDDRLEGAAACQRDHRTSARLSLERHDPEVLLAGQQDDRRSPVQARTSSSEQSAEKFHLSVARHARVPGARVRRRRLSRGSPLRRTPRWPPRSACRARAPTR